MSSLGTGWEGKYTAMQEAGLTGVILYLIGLEGPMYIATCEADVGALAAISRSRQGCYGAISTTSRILCAVEHSIQARAYARTSRLSDCPGSTVGAEGWMSV